MTSYIRKLIDSWSYNSRFLCPLQWEKNKTESNTPFMCYHTGAIINDFIYVHGGSSTPKQFAAPVNLFYRMNLETWEWESLEFKDTPALSNHACVVFEDRFFILIGGWNGKSCESKVHVFDTEKEFWISSESEGLPSEMTGLACHTANIITTPNALPQILIITSNSLVSKHQTLAFQLSTDDRFSQWTFMKLPNRAYFQLNHNTVSLEPNSLLCVGGNSSKLIQKLLIYGIRQDIRNNLVSALLTHAIDNQFHVLSSKNWGREACRSPVLIPGRFGFLFLNGVYYEKQKFRRDVYIYMINGIKSGFQYIGEIIHKTAYGVCVTDPKTGVTHYHGGLQEKNDTNESFVYSLKFFFEDVRRGFMIKKDPVKI